MGAAEQWKPGELLVGQGPRLAVAGDELICQRRALEVPQRKADVGGKPRTRDVVDVDEDRVALRVPDDVVELGIAVDDSDERFGSRQPAQLADDLRTGQ
jgi:hypothetical protein